MMKYLFIIFIVLTLAGIYQCPSFAAQPLLEEQFQQANQAYIQGKYQHAVDLYLNIAENHGVSAALLYNLANSYTKLDQPGKAIVNYKRSLRLQPGDADTKANLTQVRKDQGLYMADKPLYQRFSELLSPDNWLLVAGCAMVCLALTLVVSTCTAILPGALLFWGFWGSLLTLIITLPPAMYGYQYWNQGVVVGKEVRLLQSPFKEAAATDSIKSGRLVQPGKTHNTFTYVTDEAGRTGWLSRDQFEIIADLPSR